MMSPETFVQLTAYLCLSVCLCEGAQRHVSYASQNQRQTQQNQNDQSYESYMAVGQSSGGRNTYYSHNRVQPQQLAEPGYNVQGTRQNVRSENSLQINAEESYPDVTPEPGSGGEGLAYVNGMPQAKWVPKNNCYNYHRLGPAPGQDLVQQKTREQLVDQYSVIQTQTQQQVQHKTPQPYAYHSHPSYTNKEPSQQYINQQAYTQQFANQQSKKPQYHLDRNASKYRDVPYQQYKNDQITAEGGRRDQWSPEGHVSKEATAPRGNQWYQHRQG